MNWTWELIELVAAFVVVFGVAILILVSGVEFVRRIRGIYRSTRA